MKQLKLVTVMAALAVLCGCQSPVLEVVGPPVVEAAACAVLARQPAATAYVNLVGEVFAGYGRGEPPSAAAMQQALAELPAGGVDRATATGIWAGAVAAYAGLEAIKATPEGKARLKSLLGGIGAALHRAALGCGPAGPPAQALAAQRLVAMQASDVLPVAQAIEQQLRKAKR